MSNEIVKSENAKVTFQDLQIVFPELSDGSTTLNPASPMPIDFNENWQTEKDKLVATLTDSQESMEAIAALKGLHLGKLRRSIFFQKGLSQGAAFLTSMVVGVIVPEFLLFGTSAGAGILGSHNGSFAPLGLGLVGAAMGSYLGMIPLLVTGSYKQKVLPEDSEFENAYQARVSQWAQERYGVTMKNRWNSELKRLADDIVYVGNKDGHKVYCQEVAEGWVLTYKDGTELPVLVENKGLVNA